MVRIDRLNGGSDRIDGTGGDQLAGGVVATRIARAVSEHGRRRAAGSIIDHDRGAAGAVRLAQQPAFGVVGPGLGSTIGKVHPEQPA